MESGTRYVYLIFSTAAQPLNIFILAGFDADGLNAGHADSFLK
jgi:hypothetical protein